jgi:hypothetical protein
MTQHRGIKINKQNNVALGEEILEKLISFILKIRYGCPNNKFSALIGNSNHTWRQPLKMGNSKYCHYEDRGKTHHPGKIKISV